MRRISYIVLLILISLAISQAQGTNGRVNGEVWFKPFVRDINGFEIRRLANCEIVFQSSAAKKQVVTDQGGRYSLDLPAGVYESKASCPAAAGMPGEFHPATRTGLEIKPSADTLVNLLVSIKYLNKNSAPNGDHEPEYKRALLKQETLGVRTADGRTRKILVKYALRSSSRSEVEYQGKRDSRQDTPVSIAADSLAIYADRVSIEKPKLHVHASGHLVIEDGKQRRQGNEATIEFDAADPVSTLKFLDRPSAR
jgi:hypothetical protein